MSKKPRKAKDLLQRTLINSLSAVFMALFIFLAEFRPLRWVFTAAIAAVCVTAIWEYSQFLRKKELNPATTLSIVTAILYVFATFLKTQGPYPYLSQFWFYAPEVILGLAFFGCFVQFTAIAKSPLLNIASTFFGIVYIVIPLSCFVSIMYFFTFNGLKDSQLRGGWWIVYLIVATKSADIGGYFIGSYFGKRRLAHRLSPNKTLEGACGGLLVSTLMSLFVCFLGKRIGHIFENFSYIQSLWLGALIGVLGQIGDLAESLLKRDVGVKDSNMIPGVGGILDMIDSLLFTTPIVYIFLRIL